MTGGQHLIPTVGKKVTDQDLQQHYSIAAQLVAGKGFGVTHIFSLG
jgi:hypothetical protein